LRPRISNRTGLMEWPIHQLGGSTFVTTGGAAISPAGAHSSSSASLGFGTQRL
jgi:hypothetical protein